MPRRQPRSYPCGTDTLGKRLRWCRTHWGLRLKDVAETVRIGISQIDNYEWDHSRPSQERLVLLATFYGIATDVLLGLQPLPAQLRPLQCLHPDLAAEETMVCP